MISECIYFVINVTIYYLWEVSYISYDHQYQCVNYLMFKGNNYSKIGWGISLIDMKILLQCSWAPLL